MENCFRNAVGIAKDRYCRSSSFVVFLERLYQFSVRSYVLFQGDASCLQFQERLDYNSSSFMYSFRIVDMSYDIFFAKCILQCAHIFDCSDWSF